MSVTFSAAVEDMLSAILRCPDRIESFVRRLRLARSRYGRSYPALLHDFAGLYLRRRYTAKEIFLFDMLDRLPAEEKRRTTLSKAELVGYQLRLNPEEARPLVEDKSVFYPLCREKGLPMPELMAHWLAGGGQSADGARLQGDDEWAAFLESLDRPEIVIKPSLGVYGRGIRFLQRTGKGWRDHKERALTSSEVIDDLRRDRDYDSFVIQERVKPHAVMTELSATDYLQTMRVVTGIRGDADAEILCAEQKVMCGTATTANFAWGAAGNAIAEIDLASGTIKRALMARADGVGMYAIDKHPVTGKGLTGFALPFWTDVCHLCRTAASEFRPLRVIGWDVAVTDSGPILIEGNAFFDPHNLPRAMGPFLRFAADVLNDR